MIKIDNIIKMWRIYMNKEIIQKDEYKKIIQEIKTQIQTSQIKTFILVNKELLKLYWNIA